MGRVVQLLFMTLVGLSLAACSSTYMSGSWADPAYKGQVKDVYVIGVAKQETNRRIFEDTFARQFGTTGIKGISSYNDLPSNQELNQETIKQQMVANGADSVLITKLISQRSETVTSPGYASGYSSYGRGGYGGRRSYGGFADCDVACRRDSQDGAFFFLSEVMFAFYMTPKGNRLYVVFWQAAMGDEGPPASTLDQILQSV